MKRWLSISLIFNLLLAILGLVMVQRFGGWQFVLHRLRHSEAGLYEHRRQLFEQLPQQTGAIIFLGDSQTALCEWGEVFGDSLPILNRGIAGDHVLGVTNRLAEVLRHRPAKIFLLVGVNDLLFGQPVAGIDLRYRHLVREIRGQSPSTQLILQSILPVNGEVKNIGIGNEQVQRLNSCIARIAGEHNLPFVDIYGPLTDAAGNLSPQYTQDGIHLNGAGYLIWAQQLAPFFKK